MHYKKLLSKLETWNSDYAKWAVPLLRSVKTQVETIGSRVKLGLNGFSSLCSKETFRMAFECLNSKAKAGVDNLEHMDFKANIDANLVKLENCMVNLDRYTPGYLKKGFIPKENGELREIGIMNLVDKILQQLVVWVLMSVYEASFSPFSFAFMPGRSQFQALSWLKKSLESKDLYVLKIDIRKLFDTIPHKQLRAILSETIKDEDIMRLIGKWLVARFLEPDGRIIRNNEKVGLAQGMLIAPVLSNIFLDTVIDSWFLKNKPLYGSESFMLRFCDDMLFGFDTEAKRSMFKGLLIERLDTYGLTLNDEKTQKVWFRDNAVIANTLGFIVSKVSGRIVIKTTKRNIEKSKRRIDLLFKKHADPEICRTKVSRFLSGHFAYFGVSGNEAAVSEVYNHASQLLNCRFAIPEFIDLPPYEVV